MRELVFAVVCGIVCRLWVFEGQLLMLCEWVLDGWMGLLYLVDFCMSVAFGAIAYMVI